MVSPVFITSGEHQKSGDTVSLMPTKCEDSISNESSLSVSENVSPKFPCDKWCFIPIKIAVLFVLACMIFDLQFIYSLSIEGFLPWFILWFLLDLGGIGSILASFLTNDPWYLEPAMYYNGYCMLGSILGFVLCTILAIFSKNKSIMDFLHLPNPSLGDLILIGVTCGLYGIGCIFRFIIVIKFQFNLEMRKKWRLATNMAINV